MICFGYGFPLGAFYNDNEYVQRERKLNDYEVNELVEFRQDHHEYTKL